ncbi:hypothetical protein OG949_30510 [Streptomyces scopuliridis]|uniref:hypothetical protein n=1 Tax=Streptomyces scopuliridis TaxID=452529 RepID=UPI002DD7C21A|nr:hypothetical protein [Streptomyces scopuliridis]WSB36741.1 hypothetical protein OG949_30510 [Streptomyces scopuliridis]
MSTEARRAPVPPRPATPPPAPESEAARAGEDAQSDAPRPPRSRISDALLPPPEPVRIPPPPSGPPAPPAAKSPAPAGNPAPRPAGPPAQTTAPTTAPAPPTGSAPAPVEITTRLRPVPSAPVEITTRLRPVPPAPAGAVPRVPPRPSAPPSLPVPPRPPLRSPGSLPAPPPYPWGGQRPETPQETTTRLRPVPSRHHPFRVAAALACVVLGLGLIGGAATGSWLTGDSAADPAARDTFATARGLWHSVPVDTLFPRTLAGDGAGPGGADREWTRIGVAPDSGCSGTLDPLLLGTLRPVGCARVLRATYVDATSSNVTTVGLVFTQADALAMDTLRTRFRNESLGERADLMPRTFPVKGTVAGGFGDAQRASWTVNVLTEAPVVVFAVSGFADGRKVPAPQPVDKAMAKGATTAPAQSGLGHEAKGIADRIERGLRKTVSARTAASQ